MARYWSDGYKNTEQVGSPAETTVTMVDRVRWDNKQDPLVFDDHPVLGSESPVTSDGIARAMLQLQDFVKQKDVELCYIDVVTQADEAVLRDKTYIDIRDAYNNGKTLILRFVDSDDKCAYFYDFQGNVFRFVLFEVTDVLNMYTYWISPDDLLHTEQYSAPYKRPNPEVLSITYGDTSVKYDGSKHASINIPKVPAWALGDTKPKYDASEVGAEAKGVAASRVNAHNNSDTAHADIRNLISNVMGMFNMYATTAQLNSVTQAVQGYASAVQTLRQDAVLHTEVVDDMYTNNSRMPLSAKQGMLLRTMYDALKPVHIGVTMWNGNHVDTIPYYSTVPLANAVPCTDGGGRLSTNAPVDALHCANKKYVDDAILSSVVITEKAEGQIPVITDCAAVSPINIKLFGKGKQRQYDGHQLVPQLTVGALIKNEGDFAMEVKEDCCVINGTDVSAWAGIHYVNMNSIISEPGDYYVMGGTFVNGEAFAQVTITKGDGTKVSYNNCSFTIDGTETNASWMIQNAGTARSYTDYVIYPMLFKGTSEKTWEPYVGGEASPNMNYPQKVECLGESGSIGGKVLTKNLWNKEYASDVNNWVKNEWYDYLPIRAQKGATISVSYNQELNTGLGIFVAVGQDGNQNTARNWLYHSSAPNLINNEVSFIAKNDYIYLHCHGVITVDGRIDTFMQYIGNDLQIEYSSTKTDYEPYTEQPFTFQTPNGLRGIPLGQTIPDAIKNSPIHMSGVYWDEEEGQYYIGDTENENGKDIQRIGKERLLADKVHIIDSLCNEESNLFWLSFSAYYLATLESNFLCDIISYNHRTVDGADINTGGALNPASNIMIYIRLRKDSGITTQEEFKEYLTNNEVYAYVILQDPIITDITAEELDQYNSLVMNYPNTTIVNDAGAHMAVEYVADPKLFITNNYVDKVQHDALAARVLVLEQHVINS